jgi:hypothetical protein
MKGIRNSKTARAGWRIATIAGSGAMALAFGLLMTAMPAAAAAGPTCTVPGDYSTIQGAVNDTNCTTINVAADTYNENVTINHTLTLKGANAGKDPNTGPRDAESIISGNPAIEITATAPDVVVDGFTVNGPSGSGVVIKGNGAVITNNILSGIVSDSSTAQAISIYRGPDGVEISHNLIEKVSGDQSTKGVFIEDTASKDPSVGVVVNGNVITQITSTSKGAYGVLLNNGNGNTANYGLVIENNDINTLSSGSGWVHAVGIEANAPNVTVAGNSFSNLTASGPDVVAVWFEREDPSYTSSKVNGNNFNFPKGTSVYGIAVDTNPPDPAGFDVAGMPLDGTCNFWGTSTGPSGAGPGFGALVSPLVTFSPWSKNPAPQGPCVPK